MTPRGFALAGLKRERPEWAPWLGVIEEVLHEAARPAWNAMLDAMPHDRSDSPLLHGASVSVPDRVIEDWFTRLVRSASRSGAPGMSGLDAAASAAVDVERLFVASVQQDYRYVENVAVALDVNREALQAVAALLAIPFLQACQRRWGPSLPKSWVEGHCPLCGAWPAYAEVRGIERTRCLRCGRCGAAWHARPLHCPFCATDSHDELVSLVPQKPGTNAVVEACTRCFGYLKTVTTLQGCPPEAVMLEDLATVDLDVAAIEQGYARPPGAGSAISIAVNGRQPQET